jgi:hypothetical protein
MDDVVAWSASWAWSLPLIVLNVTFHVIGLGFIHSKGVQILGVVRDHRLFLSMFALVMGVTAILVTMLHGLEAGFWAAAFRVLGALPDNKSAILYSLGALTTFGHTDLFLAAHWQLMGALEALNGVILFGLTTAFLYGMIQRVWLAESEERVPAAKPWSRRKRVVEAIAPAFDHGGAEVVARGTR